MASRPTVIAEFGRYSTARGSKSRNKVLVGEPACGSLTYRIERGCESSPDQRGREIQPNTLLSLNHTLAQLGNSEWRL